MPQLADRSIRVLGGDEARHSADPSAVVVPSAHTVGVACFSLS